MTGFAFSKFSVDRKLIDLYLGEQPEDTTDSWAILKKRRTTQVENFGSWNHSKICWVEE